MLTDLAAAFEKLGKLQDKRFLIVHVSLRAGVGGAVLMAVSQGTDDQIVPYSEVDKIKRYIPQANLVSIEGGSHYLPMERGSWEKLAECVGAFLSV